MLDESHRVAFPKNTYKSIDAMLTGLDTRLNQYNNDRKHLG